MILKCLTVCHDHFAVVVMVTRDPYRSPGRGRRGRDPRRGRGGITRPRGVPRDGRGRAIPARGSGPRTAPELPRRHRPDRDRFLARMRRRWERGETLTVSTAPVHLMGDFVAALRQWSAESRQNVGHQGPALPPGFVGVPTAQDTTDVSAVPPGVSSSAQVRDLFGVCGGFR